LKTQDFSPAFGGIEMTRALNTTLTFPCLNNKVDGHVKKLRVFCLCTGLLDSRLVDHDRKSGMAVIPAPHKVKDKHRRESRRVTRIY